MLGYRDVRVASFFYKALRAFVSPGVLEILAKTYDLKPTTTAEADLKAILG